MIEEDVKLSWWARILRSRATLTYWLNDDKYQADVTDFKEVTPDCIVFRDFLTMKKTMVRYICSIIYQVEEVK